MHLFDTLANYQKGVKVARSEDYYFYMQNRHLLNGIEMYRFLLDPKDIFDIIRANIIIQAIKNKRAIEEAIVSAYKESNLNTQAARIAVQSSLIDLPYVLEGANKFYVPIFSRAVNAFYNAEFAKLLKEPYASLMNKYKSSCVDLFDMYNFALYDSLFTKLVTVKKSENVVAMYHFDFKTMFIINSQGRCDAKICIFDKYLKHPNTDHIIDRLKVVAQKYIDGDKEGFLDALQENELISEKLIQKIKHQDFKVAHNIERKAK